MSQISDQSVQFERASHRSDVLLYVAAALVFFASAAATAYFCWSMSGGMEMPGGWTMSMMWMPMSGLTWLESIVMFLLMWVAMMIAMMLPSAMPMIRRYKTDQCCSGGGGSTRSSIIMATGYFFIWAIAGAVLFPLGVLFAQATMHSSALSRSVPILMGISVILAGLVQFAPWTTRALSHCRGPFSCAMPSPRDKPLSSFRQGIHCGLSCVTCCFGPTIILLALGMMNPAVIIAVAAVIALEKLLPNPIRTVRIIGACSIILGIAMIALR